MILYFGNKLSKHGFTRTFMEDFIPKLNSISEVKSASDKKNKILRLLDMLKLFFLYFNKTKIIFIDVYSGYGFYYALAISSLASFFSIPYLTILHGGNLPNRLRNSIRLSNKIFSNSIINISPSIYLEKYFSKEGYLVKYIPNFISTDKYEFKFREQCQPRLLWVRSFHEIYNPKMAILVFKKIVEEFPDAELCMVGPDKDGSLIECKEITKQLLLDKQIIFTGLLSKSEWIELSKSYDIFLNTTNFDNMPISIIEAMCLGFPIVSTNVGGLQYLLEDKKDALLVDKNDISSMKNKIVDIINNVDLAKKLSTNVGIKAETFSWIQVKDSWISIIREFEKNKN